MGQKPTSSPPRFTIFGRGSYAESLRIGTDRDGIPDVYGPRSSS